MKNHRPKRDMARIMLNRAERKAHTSVFDSAAWQARKKAIQDKVKKKQGL